MSAYGRIVSAALAAVLIAFPLTACENQKASEVVDQPAQEQVAPNAVTVNVAAPHGTGSVGLASLMSKVAEGSDLKGNYHFAITTSLEQIPPALEGGYADIAILSPSAAASYYNQTGGITVLAISSMSPVALVTSDDSISSLADLRDKTVFFSGAGAEALQASQHLLELLQLDESVEIEVINDPAVAVARLSKEKGSTAFLAQPYAAQAVTGEGKLRRVVDLADAWGTLASDGSQMVSSIVVARNEFVAQHPKITAEFLAALTESSQLAVDDPIVVNPMVADAGILEAELLDERVLPLCHPLCIQGPDMKTALSGYLQTLYDIDPYLIGGEMPGDDFYYGA